VLIGATGNDDEALCRSVCAAVGSPAGPWCADAGTLAAALLASTAAIPTSQNLGSSSSSSSSSGSAVCCAAAAVAGLEAADAALLAGMPRVIVLRGPACGDAAAWAPLRMASAFEVVVPALSTAAAATSAATDVARLLALAAAALPPGSSHRRAAASLEMGPDTFFLSTTCKHVKELAPLMAEIEAEVDVLELRAVGDHTRARAFIN
jgi:hypothetical protein